MSDLRSLYSQLSDNELLSMTHFGSSDYTEEAIEVAKSILAERGLSNPSNDILQQVKAERHNESEKAIRSKDMFRVRKLKQAIKDHDYCYLAKYFFWFIVFYGCYSGFEANTGSTKGKMVSLFGPLKPEYSFLGQLICSIAVFGILPVIYFIAHSSKLSRGKRKEHGLSLFMPKYILIVYGISLLLLIVPIVLWSLGL